jgi:hypothetical protein
MKIETERNCHRRQLRVGKPGEAKRGQAGAKAVSVNGVIAAELLVGGDGRLPWLRQHVVKPTICTFTLLNPSVWIKRNTW